MCCKYMYPGSLPYSIFADFPTPSIIKPHIHRITKTNGQKQTSFIWFYSFVSIWILYFPLIIVLLYYIFVPVMNFNQGFFYCARFLSYSSAYTHCNMARADKKKIHLVDFSTFSPFFFLFMFFFCFSRPTKAARLYI